MHDVIKSAHLNTLGHSRHTLHIITHKYKRYNKHRNKKKQTACIEMSISFNDHTLP